VFLYKIVGEYPQSHAAFKETGVAPRRMEGSAPPLGSAPFNASINASPHGSKCAQLITSLRQLLPDGAERARLNPSKVYYATAAVFQPRKLSHALL
jgi:hypothetical protein